MLEAIVQGFGAVFLPNTLLLIFLAVILGTIFGIIPGIGGLALLAVLLPFTYGMDPAQGLAFLMAGNAVCHVGGAITSILLAIPGDPPNAATIIDGYPMTQQGKGGRALGAGLTAAGLGGIVGAIFLGLTMPILRPIAFAFNSPEIFLVIFMAIIFIGVLGRGSMVKGLISGGTGLFLAFVGYQALTGIPRFYFGSLYLIDGIRLIPVVLGLFAIPEALELMATGAPIAKDLKSVAAKGDVMEGIKDVFRHWSVFLRSCVIGLIVGVAPGAGAETAPWIAYGHAKQVSKHPEKFGNGAVEGVIAPQVACTSVKGGDLVPTLSFGIPGSSSMALLLGAFLILGLVPGPLFLKEHPDIAFTLVGAMTVGFVLATALCLALAVPLAKIALIPGHILGPIILAFLVIGAYATDYDIMDVAMTFVFGALGYAMKIFDYNRPALLLGLVLGKLAETYFHISIQAYGWLFFTSPISIILLSITILTLSRPGIQYMVRKIRK